jgi:hypothetical protein
MSDEEKYYRQPWMTDDQWKAADTIATAVGGHHHMKQPKPFGKGVRVVMFSSIAATYDGDLLTRLVVLAHDRAVRIEVAAAGSYIAVNAWHRGRRDGSMYERHPTLADAVSRILPNAPDQRGA